MSPLPRSLPTVSLPTGQQLWRIHRASLAPVWFGPAPGDPPRNRFDAPGGEYRICYLGDSAEVAFAETLIRQPRSRLLPRAMLDERSASTLRLQRDINLACVHGPGLVRLGLGADVAHGQPYDRCQGLAREIWQHADSVDGIQYRSRWDNDRLCLALFDRAADALGEPESTLPLAQPDLIGPILTLFDIGIL